MYKFLGRAALIATALLIGCADETVERGEPRAADTGVEMVGMDTAGELDLGEVGDASTTGRIELVSDVELPDAPVISEEEALDRLQDERPDLDFDDEVMYGPEEMDDGTWRMAVMGSALVGVDVVEVLLDAHDGTFLKEVVLPGMNARAAACSLPVTYKFSQRDARWSSTKLGNSTSDTIGAYGCVVSTIAMWYANEDGRTSATPATVNTSAKSRGCFGSGSSLINVDCAVDQYASRSVSSISVSDLATTLCAGTPVLFKRAISTGDHMVYGYGYTGGSTTSSSSYNIIDPWDGTAKSLSSYPTKAASSPYRKVN